MKNNDEFHFTCETITFTPKLLKLNYKQKRYFSSHFLFPITGLAKKIETISFALVADNKLVQNL